MRSPNLALVVDDDRASRILCQVLLTKLGWDVEMAAGGEEGFRMANSKPYQLILMDVELGDLDGLAVTRRIRASGGPSSESVILACTITDDRNACIEAGMSDFLRKPVSLADFRAMIERNLGA